METELAKEFSGPGANEHGGSLFKLNKNFRMVTAEHQTMPGPFKGLGSVPPRRLHTHEGVVIKSFDPELREYANVGP